MTTLVGRVGLVLGCAVPVACSHPAPAAPVAPAPAAERVALPAALTAPRSTLLLGDLHGTRELPAFVGRVVATLAEAQPVVLGLEIPADQAPAIPAFLASDGGPAARAAVLRDPFWQQPYQDGRRSLAMLELLDTARQLRAAGKRVEVELFDPKLPDGAAPDAREDGMTRRVLAIRAARPDAMLVVYAGNLHTMRAPYPAMPDYEWMGMRLARAGLAFVTLGPRWAAGSAWVCMGSSVADCGARHMNGKGGDAPGVALGATPDGQYDGWFDVGPVNASPPAAFPDQAITDAQLAALRAPPAT